MQKQMIKTTALAFVCWAAALPLATADNSSLDSLQGKWIAKKTSPEGQAYTQTIEIKKDKLAFQLAASDGELRFFAKGIVKAEKLGTFNVLAISDIQGGTSADATEAVNDDRVTPYVLEEETLTLASNFDKVREKQKASLDVYTRVAGSKESASTSGSDAGQLVGDWKLEIAVNDASRKYDLHIKQADGKLQASIVSPRSGEHKCKTATYADGKLVLEIDREIEGNNATFVYTGKLDDGKLAGTVVAKDHEDLFSGKWTAQK